MRYVTATQGKCDSICIGRQGENKVVTVQFDVSGWEEEYGAGEFVLLFERSGDTAAYPCAITVTNDILNWVITSAETYYKGRGRVQLMYVVNSAIAKSVIYTTVTLLSLDGGDPPNPTPEWIQQVLQYGAEMEDSQHNAEAWAVGERGGVPVTEEDETYHNNSEWYAMQAADSAEEALAYKNNALESKNAAAISAQQAAAFVGSPYTALLVSEMTDTDHVYVYVGTELGYINGDWYYYNGEEWVSGGVYNSVAVDAASVEDYLEAMYS